MGRKEELTWVLVERLKIGMGSFLEVSNVGNMSLATTLKAS
jgi:hypothetical protein